MNTLKLREKCSAKPNFLRLVFASFVLASEFNISCTSLANVAVNLFASALAGLLFSKGLNYIREAPKRPLSQIEGIVTKAANKYALYCIQIAMFFHTDFQ